MLVPTHTPGAEAMLRRHSKSRRQRLGQALLALGVRSGLLQLLPVWRLVPSRAQQSPQNTEDIEDFVRAHVPSAASLGVLFGPVRANAKPVLRVFDALGRTVAFGKVAHDEPSAALVRREAYVLGELAGARLESLVLPAMLHAGPWGEAEVLLMTPLGTADSPATHRTPPSWELPLAAMIELAEHEGTTKSGVATSTYLERLRERTRLAQSGTASGLEMLLERVERVERHRGATVLRFGRWHGDWAPWNMGLPAGVGQPVQVWDWERSETDVPLGFDVVHFLLQRAFFRGTSRADIGPALVRDGTWAMSCWYPDHEAVEATILLYLLEILARYRSDGGQSPTPQLAARIAAIEGVLDAVMSERPRSSHVIA